jgi:hypothetical protein
MLKIVLIGWNDLDQRVSFYPKESVELIKTAFENKGVEVRLIGEHSCNIPSLLYDWLEQESFDFVLIVNRFINVEIVKNIKERNHSLYFFNWDEPHATFFGEVQKFMPYIDKAFGSCKVVEKNYLDGGAKKFTYLPPCYSNTYHFPDYDPEYDCDISFICTNLYKDFNSKRYDICKKLIDAGFKFYIYGPEWLRSEFPDNYRGFLSYANNRKLFSSSKINLSLHLYDDDGYISERDITILASGGLMLTDHVKGMDKILCDEKGICYCLIEDDLIEQVRTILNNIDKYTSIKTRALQIVKKFSDENFVNTILI